jgi:hypothetical protein
MSDLDKAEFALALLASAGIVTVILAARIAHLVIFDRPED